MGLLEQIINCKNDEQVNNLITNAIKDKNKNSKKTEQIGFLELNKIESHKGFIPLNTRIKYTNLAVETYGMETTDFFYEFAHFIRKYNINNKGSLIYNLEYFINKYFGLFTYDGREEIFYSNAYQTTTTDDELFEKLENNKIGDLKNKGVAMCTERAALAEQLLSLFGFDSHYVIGCVKHDNKEEPHAYNIVKRKEDYALLDYSLPVIKYNNHHQIVSYYPFVGILSKDEYNDFIYNGELKEFNDYEYNEDNKKIEYESKRTYVAGSIEIDKSKSL